MSTKGTTRKSGDEMLRYSYYNIIKTFGYLYAITIVFCLMIRFLGA